MLAISCRTRIVYSLFYRYIKIRHKSCERNVVKSKVPDIVIPKQLIHDFVWMNLSKWANKTAVICFETGKQYTYEELYKKSKYLSNSLQKFNLTKGDRIAIILPNISDFPIAFLGSLQAGLVVTTVNPYYTPEEMSIQLKDANSKLIITIHELYPQVVKAQGILNQKAVVILASFKAHDIIGECIKLDDLCHKNDDLSVQLNAEDVALLPYSSGTTGLAKGVRLTHQNVVSNLYQMSHEKFAIHQETNQQFQDVIPIFLPLFHIYGMVGIFLNFLAKGCKLVMIPNFTAPQFTKLMRSYQPTLIFAVPQIIASILNQAKLKVEDLSSIRTIVSAAAPLGNSAVDKFNLKTNHKIDLLQMYGMTETSPLTLMQTTKLQNGTKIGGSGFLLPNTKCKIVSVQEEDAYDGLGQNVTGELVVRGPQVMKGYHKSPHATEEVLFDNWLKTGDIGHYDESGHFFITDRLKELIKVKGFQVAPAELEEILKMHSEVADVAVVGVPHPVQGEAPRAFIVLKNGVNCVKKEQIKEFVACKVANYKRLVGGVVFVDAIPRNSAGKVLRRHLKTM